MIKVTFDDGYSSLFFHDEYLDDVSAKEIAEIRVRELQLLSDRSLEIDKVKHTNIKPLDKLKGEQS